MNRSVVTADPLTLCRFVFGMGELSDTRWPPVNRNFDLFSQSSQLLARRPANAPCPTCYGWGKFNQSSD